MRSLSPLAVRPRRVLAVAGLASIASGLLTLTGAAHPVRAAASASSSSAGKPSPAVARQFEGQVKGFQAQGKRLAAVSHSSTTVTGPHMYDPATGKPFPNASTVTVTQTASLVNQQVQVSWTNFTPSGALVYNPSNVPYPVMVAECKGTNPSSPADCYAAQNGGVTSTSGKYGPDNTSYATTGSNGTGFTDVDILTFLENQFLGCKQSSPCSLAIVPAQGGLINPTKGTIACGNHTQDTFTAVGSVDFGANFYSCSWAQRIVIPIKFARSSAFCPFRNSVFSVAGSPMAVRAIESWRAALCVGSHGLHFAYDSTIAEPLALTDLGTGQTDVALTTRPAAAQGISTGSKHYLYAPVAVSAISVAYWFDDPLTGLPQTGIKLDQRLLLKLLTQSYSYENDACQRGVPPPPNGCDNGVDGNAEDLFVDPEFTQLNPSVLQPVNGAIEVPTVVSGQTDLTWTLTNWIAANKDASSFLTGQFDPWANHLNTNYLGLQYPNNTLVGQDPFIIVAHEYNPVYPLSFVASDQVLNWPPATSINKNPVTGNYDRLAPQLPGQRALIAILDQGDSAAFLFPSAALPNASGKFVAPTTAGMTAALQGMTSEDGTKQVNINSKNKHAYPLTMVIYAVVPTSGTPHAKAAAIARFLDFAAGVGQTPGVQPGQLPPGFAPLPASMRAQTRKDAQAVLHQTGATPPSKTTNNPKTGSGPSTPKPAKSPPGSASLPAATPSPSATGNGVSLVNVANVRPASITRYILPALLILGGLAALAGSSSLIGSSSTPISARLRRIGRGSRAWGRAARGRLGWRRSK